MILRTRKRENPFAQIDKRLLEDKRLSWKARGILAYLLSKTDNWKVLVCHLTEQSDKDGRDAVLSALREMQELGYLTKQQGRAEKGTMQQVEYWIHEEPQPVNPPPPQTGLPLTANPTLRNNEVNVIKNLSSPSERDISTRGRVAVGPKDDSILNDTPTAGGGTHPRSEPPFPTEPRAPEDDPYVQVIYDIYPRKKCRADAYKAISKAIKREAKRLGTRKEAFEFLAKRTKRYAISQDRRTLEDRKFIPYPASWFNDEGYHDEDEEYTPSLATNKPDPEPIPTQAFVEAWIKQEGYPMEANPENKPWEEAWKEICRTPHLKREILQAMKAKL